MAKLDEIIYNIKNLKGGGTYSDDTELSDEQIIFIVDYYRAKLIIQAYNKNKRILDGIDQALPKISISKDTLLFPTVEEDHLISQEIPSLVNLPNGNAFRKVGKGSNSFDYIEQGRAGIIKHARFSSGEGYFYKLGNRIVLITDGINVSKIPIVGVFEHPMEVIDFGREFPSYNYNVEYPLPANMLDTIYKMMIESEFRFSFAIPDDKTNNTQDDQ